MGQGPSVDHGLAELKHQQGKLQAHISILGQLATLTYTDFVKSVEDLNKITATFSDSRGKQLQFVVKKGTDDSFLWKATVRIRCYKINTRTKTVDSCRALTLRQYCQMHREISDQVSQLSNLQSPRPTEVTASAIFNDFDTDNMGVEDDNECCICMERKAEVILGCGHNFCEICIDSWTSQRSRSNCPLCREKVTGSDDTWVLTEKPDSSDYETDLKGYLVGLADRPT
ncbi:RING finger protein 141-like [Littorina saxatilis]|uniref:RING finger protein 141 n=1 Tax=Littorina saxatilis TaxID=31220 RepID=A0AAN9B4B6_9CAEN